MKSFILYSDMCRNILALLNDKQAGSLFRMIVGYANNEGQCNTDDVAVQMAFEIIRSGLDANVRAYEEMCEKRRESGRLGGLARASKGKQTLANEANASNVSKGKQTLATLSNNNIIQYKNNIIKNNIIKEEESNDSLSSSTLDFARLVAYFNGLLKEYNSLMPQVKQLNETRKKMLKARVREFGKEALVSVFKKAAASDFLNGKNNRNFVASFDWLLKPTNFPKVLEGNYDNPVNTKPTDPLTANANGLLQQVKQEQQQRVEDERQRILGIYQAAQDGDDRSIAIVESMRKNGTLKKFNLE